MDAETLILALLAIREQEPDEDKAAEAMAALIDGEVNTDELG